MTEQPLILCIGEAMLELSQDAPGAGGAGDEPPWRLGVAGDVLNTAWYLRRLLPASGWRVGLASRTGTGPFSQRLGAFLDRAGIERAAVHPDPAREIGLYAITLTAGGERSFTYWRGQSAARGLADDPAQLAADLAGARLALFSGITLAILPPAGRQVLLDTLARARAAGTQVVFDPNLRPRLWEDAAALRHWVSAAAAVSDLVLPSLDDERALFGDAGAAATIARYLALGVGQVVVKDGPNPVHFGGSEGAGMVGDLPAAVPVDTTAAGDSFNAGYLAARLQGRAIPDAIRAGHAVAIRVIGQRGAIVPLERGADAAPLPDN